MPFKASPNQLEERKIYKLFRDGYTAEEISEHMAIEVANIRLYDPDYVEPAKPVEKIKLEPKKKTKGKPSLEPHSDKGEVLRV